MLKNSSLEGFGYNFLGPILSTYIEHTNRQLQVKNKKKPIKVFHLAREGYALQKAFEIVNNHDIPSEYLYVSRSFLFRIMLDIEASWEFSIKHNFEGTMEELFQQRFSYSQDQITQVLNSKQRRQEISLPCDYQKVCIILSDNLVKLKKLNNSARKAYLHYLESIGFTSIQFDPVMLDIGYSGTIQKLLTLLVGRDTHGVYMITTQSGKYRLGENTADIRHVFRTGLGMGEGYMMLDRSMFLEALLTAPDGQFIDLIQDVNDESFHFCFGKRTYTQESFSDLEVVLKSALRSIKDNRNVGITYSIEEVEQMYKAYVTQRFMVPKACWPLFVLDDSISGEGTLHPLEFFGL